MTLPSSATIGAHRPVRLLVPAWSEARAAGSLLLIVGVAFMTVTMLAASIAPGYDFNGAAISDLGTIPETALLFNGLLLGIGVLNVAAGYLLYRMGGGARLLGLFVVAGLGAVGAGLFPLDAGTPHALFALLAFVCMNLEALAAARLFHGAIRWLGAAAGALGLLYVVIMAMGDGGNPAIFGAIGHGGAERMIAYPVMLWMIAAGGYLLADGGRPTAPDGP